MNEITWKCNTGNDFIDSLTGDELELFQADIQDAIDGVIEDWGNK